MIVVWVAHHHWPFIVIRDGLYHALRCAMKGINMTHRILKGTELDVQMDDWFDEAMDWLIDRCMQWTEWRQRGRRTNGWQHVRELELFDNYDYDLTIRGRGMEGYWGMVIRSTQSCIINALMHTSWMMDGWTSSMIEDDALWWMMEKRGRMIGCMTWLLRMDHTLWHGMDGMNGINSNYEWINDQVYMHMDMDGMGMGMDIGCTIIMTLVTQMDW